MVPTRLRPVRRTQQPRVIASLSEARDRIAGTAWFLKCGIRDGQPDDALWLNNLSEWPGPEDPRCAEFALLGQALYDELVSQGQSLADTFWEIERLARADAAKYSVGYSDAEDTWHPPTARVCEAAWWAALMATYAGAAVDMPPDIWEVWLWFEGGHWAAGVADLQAPELSALIML